MTVLEQPARTDSRGPAATSFAERVGRVMRKHGVGGTLRLLLAQATPRGDFAADYVWHRLDLTRSERPRLLLPPGCELRRAGPADVATLVRMPRDSEVTTMSERLVRRRLLEGATPWLVLCGGEPVFSCWTFERALPVSEERAHRLALPYGVVGLEDSLVLPDHRGRGIGSAAWSQIAARLASAGTRAIVVKIDVRNAPSRRVAAKAGFEEVAAMQIARRARRTRVRVELPAQDAGFGWLGTLERG